MCFDVIMHLDTLLQVHVWSPRWPSNIWTWWTQKWFAAESYRWQLVEHYRHLWSWKLNKCPYWLNCVWYHRSSLSGCHRIYVLHFRWPTGHVPLKGELWGLACNIALKSAASIILMLYIFISCLCYDVSVRLSVTDVHWRIIANLGFKFRSKFTAHCGHGEG